MRVVSVRSLGLACLLALAFAQVCPAHAGGIGISEPPDSIPPAPPLGTSGTAVSDKAFHLYKVPVERGRRANRDYEFLWSHTYVDRFHTPLDSLRGTPAMNDMDRLGDIMCEEEGRNPFGIPLTELELTYNFLAQQESYRDELYDPNPFATVGFRVARPDYLSLGNEGTHLDTYIYAPSFSAYPTHPEWPAYLGDGAGSSDRKNYGMSPSEFVWGSEDSLGGHNGSPLHANSLMIPGPVPWKVAHTEQEDFWRWTRPGGGANAQLTHEGLHTLNDDTHDGANDFLHLFASAAEVVTGVSIDPGYDDVDYTASLAPISGNASRSYPHWQGFTAYLAFNFRGPDTTIAGYSDDLLRRWAKRPRDQRTMLGLAARLSDAECEECLQYTPFAGLSDFDRVQRLIHDWRVAMYVNNATLPGGHWGYPPRFGFSPAEQLGAWRDINAYGDNSYAIPPIVNIGPEQLNQELRFGDRPAGPGASARPLRLLMFGAEYFVFKADPALASGQQSLAVRVHMPGLLKGRRTWDNCNTVEYSGRLFASVVTYSEASDSLYAHPEWATGVTTQSRLLDRINQDLAFDVPGFGTATKAVVVVVTLEDGPEGAHSKGNLWPQFRGSAWRADSTNRYLFEVAATAGVPVLPADPLVVAGTAFSESSPAWSPRGDSLAFEAVDATGHRGIMIAPALGAGSARPLRSGSLAQYEPTWSPRDGSVAYAQARSGGRDLWRVTVAGIAQQLTNLPGSVREPTFSPNGSQIAYLQYVRTNPPPEDTTTILPPGNQTWASELRLHTVDSGADIVLLSFAGDSVMSNLRWSPDGKRLFLYGTGEAANEPWHFYQYDVIGHQLSARDAMARQSISFDPAPGIGKLLLMRESHYVWVPTFESMSATCGMDTTTRHFPFQDIVRRDTSSGSIIPLSQATGVMDRGARWSPDGTKVAWTTIDGGNADVVVGASTLDKSPTFTSLQSSYSVPNCDAWVMSLAATDPDGDAVTYEVFDLPAGAQIQNGNQLRWEYPAVGQHWIVARALDPQGAVASRVVLLDVYAGGPCGGGGGEEDPDPILGGHSARRADSNRLIGGGASGPARIANTFLDGAESGAWVAQTARLLAARSDSAGQVRTRLAALRAGMFAVDRARLLVVDHDPGTVAVATPAGLAVGAKHRAAHVANDAGDDLTQSLKGAEGDARLFTAGSTLSLNWAAGDGIAGLVLDCARASAADPASEWGVRIDVPDGQGWALAGRIHPRSSYDALAATITADTPVRLTFLTDTYVREVAGYSLGESEGGAATVTAVELSGTDVASGVETLASTDEAAVELSEGQGVTLLFDGPAPVADRQRTLFLDLVASFTPEFVSGASSQSTDEALPVRFALNGNQPNPFGGGTTIRFDTPRPADIQIVLFDAQGRRIRTLADGPFAAGTHAVVWDGTDAAGQRVRPGVYLYRMTAPGFRDQGRMVMLGR